MDKYPSLVYATDLHLTDRQPANRVTPVANCIAVFSNLCSFAMSKGGLLVLGGDLFDYANPSYNLLISVIDVIQAHEGLKIYICRGNHDVNYANMDNPAGIDALHHAGLINYMHSNEDVFVGWFHLCAYEYDPKLPLCLTDKENKVNLTAGIHQNPDVYRQYTTVTIAHLPIVTKKVPYSHILTDDIEVDSEYLLCGHIHERFTSIIHSKCPFNGGTTTVINPGCLFRLKRNEANINPQAVVISRVGNKSYVSYQDIPGDPDPEFLKEEPEAISFTQAVDEAKIEVSDIEAYIHNSKYDSPVKSEALKLIQEAKDAI